MIILNWNAKSQAEDASCKHKDVMIHMDFACSFYDVKMIIDFEVFNWKKLPEHKLFLIKCHSAFLNMFSFSKT